MRPRVPSPAAAPLYASVLDDLLARIARGALPPGSVLPSESALCREYGVSRITIRRALDGLAERRLIRRSQGAGTLVCEAEELGKSVFLTGYIDDVIPLNRHQVVSDVIGEPPEAVRVALKLEPSMPTRCITSVNFADDLPLSYTHFWFAPDCASLIAPADFRGSLPPIRVVEQRSGRPVVRAEQTVDPVVADEEVAERLALPVGAPVLQALRTYFDAQDRPLECIVVRYHPGRYRFRVTLVPKVTPVRRTAASGPSDGTTAARARRRPRLKT